MNKTKLIEVILDKLQLDLEQALLASHKAHESATHSESKAENKYDTRGLEAAYLAHGLSVRAQELQQAIIEFRQLLLPTESDNIQQGSLVLLEDDNDNQRWFFLAPQAGGLTLEWQDLKITTVTPSAPLGHGLIGRQLDDEVCIRIHDKPVNYLICQII